MAGTALNEIRSAWVAESTPGTTPTTPGFTTETNAIAMTATPETYMASSLAYGGETTTVGVNAIPVTGTMGGSMVYGNLDDWMASLMQGSWESNVLKNGKTRSAMTVENTIPAGAGGTATMLRYRGVEAVGGKISLASKAEVQFTLDLLGMGSDDATTTAIAGATYTDPSNIVPLTSGLDVGTITMAGYTPGCIQAAEIDFAFDGRDPQEIIGSLDLCGVTPGAFRPKLSVTALVNADFAAMYSAARSVQAQFAVNIPIGSVTGNKYTIAFPKCVFGSADLDLSGNTLLQKLEIIPAYDTVSSASVTITRAVA